MRLIDDERGVATACMKQCLEFYAEGLFFTKESECSTTCTLSLGSQRLVFRKAHRDEVRSLCVLSGHLSFSVDDIHDYYHRIRAAGTVKLQHELDLEQPGLWSFSLVDPNGYHVHFWMSAGESNRRSAEPGSRMA